MRKESVGAGLLFALTVLLGVASAIFLLMGYPDATGGPGPEWASVIGSLAFCAVGALILSRSDARAIGFLFCLGGFAVQFENAGAGYLEYVLERDASSLTEAALVGLLADAMWVPSIALGVVYTFLLFPTGSLPSPRWRPVFWVTTVVAVASVPLTLFAPGPLHYAESVDNPLGIEAAAELISTARSAAAVGIFLPMLASIAALVLRFRRAGTVERLQMKWFLFASTLLVIGIPIGIGLNSNVFGALLGEVLFALIPVSVAVGILRYRLFDIDTIINRALVYGALSAVLAGAYLAIVFGLQQIMSVGSDSDVAVAASTLAVAGLFRPARRRVQHFIDRRFYRRRYDGALALEELSAQLRHEVTLDALRDDVMRTIDKTVQPAHVSLWLREVA